MSIFKYDDKGRENITAFRCVREYFHSSGKGNKYEYSVIAAKKPAKVFVPCRF
jgi:hypothetical protein